MGSHTNKDGREKGMTEWESHTRMTEEGLWLAEWGHTYIRMAEKSVWLNGGHTHKDDRENGMAEWGGGGGGGAHTRVAERKGYGWLNGVTHKDDREKGMAG